MSDKLNKSQLRSLGELRAANANMNEQYKRINEVLDYRKQEVQMTMQQLYAQVEDFRANQHTELRREIEVAYDMAIRQAELEWLMVPWWKKLLGATVAMKFADRADVFLKNIKVRVNLAHVIVEKEMQERMKEEADKKTAEEVAATRKANPVLAEVADGMNPANAEKPEVKDGYGRPVDPQIKELKDQIAEKFKKSAEETAQAIREIDNNLLAQQKEVDGEPYNTVTDPLETVMDHSPQGPAYMMGDIK